MQRGNWASGKKTSGYFRAKKRMCYLEFAFLKDHKEEWVQVKYSWLSEVEKNR